jgi:hypothetical protein
MNQVSGLVAVARRNSLTFLDCLPDKNSPASAVGAAEWRWGDDRDHRRDVGREPRQSMGRPHVSEIAGRAFIRACRGRLPTSEAIASSPCLSSAPELFITIPSDGSAGATDECRRAQTVNLSCARPRHRNHVWSYDFVEAQTHDGRKLRLMTLVDEFTRKCLAIRVARRINSFGVSVSPIASMTPSTAFKRIESTSIERPRWALDVKRSATAIVTPKIRSDGFAFFIFPKN